MTDWNKDGTPDLVAIKKSNTGTNTTEVHILKGPSPTDLKSGHWQIKIHFPAGMGIGL